MMDGRDATPDRPSRQPAVHRLPPSRRVAGLLGAAGAALLLLVTVSIGTSGPAAMAQAAEAEASPSVDAGLIAEALRILGERYVDEDALTTENLTAGAIRGMVEALGDEGHTEYLTAEEYAAEQDALDGRVLGIGVVLDQRARAPLRHLGHRWLPGRPGRPASG